MFVYGAEPRGGRPSCFANDTEAIMKLFALPRPVTTIFSLPWTLSALSAVGCSLAP